MPAPLLSVILPTRNPHPGRLHRTLRGLASQTLERSQWEIVVVDNASDAAWEIPTELLPTLPPLRRVAEPIAGLTPARLCGIATAAGDLLVFVDDDNVLSPGYLTAALARFAHSPSLGAAGGPVLPEWETVPPAWTAEFHGLLALRDLGREPQLCRGGPTVPWPTFAPVGAGLVIRHAAAASYAAAVRHDLRRSSLDRARSSLGSGGDNDLVFTTLHAGGDVGYFPELSLTHLIPAGRLDAPYLTRLNRGIMRTWVRVLALHNQCGWPPISHWTIPLRHARARWRLRHAPEPARSVRLGGILGQFEGQADLRKLTLRPLA